LPKSSGTVQQSGPDPTVSRTLAALLAAPADAIRRLSVLVEVADTVTDMHNVKHAYEAGILAAKGIDF